MGVAAIKEVDAAAGGRGRGGGGGKIQPFKRATPREIGLLVIKLNASTENGFWIFLFLYFIMTVCLLRRGVRENAKSSPINLNFVIQVRYISNHLYI